jgi:hypothetical protein
MFIYQDADIVITAKSDGKKIVRSVKTGRILTMEERNALEVKRNEEFDDLRRSLWLELGD